ncbi:hypothetical protein [Acetobacter sp. DsW_54]|uniref:hypothetical protein n=1 Tax=Acetobacter sp. DsW_54 TaxID=1670660 RepID=UPI00130299F9|nr:hypothetical protein [Acetobacter sp. DsW_54]
MKENVTCKPQDIPVDYMSNFKNWLANVPVQNERVPSIEIKLPNSIYFLENTEVERDNLHLPERAVYTFAIGSTANLIFASLFIYYYLSGNNKGSSWSLLLLLVSMLFVWKSINEAREFKEKHSV